MTIAGLTPDGWDIILRDEHVESSEIDGDVDLVGIQTYISSAGRAYELADRWRRRGAKVVLGGLHPTSMPHEAAAARRRRVHRPGRDRLGSDPRRLRARAVAEVLSRALRRLGRPGAAAPARPDEPSGPISCRHTMVTSRGCPHACDFCYKSSFWGPTYYEPRPIAAVERELSGDRRPSGLLSGRQPAWPTGVMPARCSTCCAARGSSGRRRRRSTWPAIRATSTRPTRPGCRSLFVGFESLSPENMRGNNKLVNAATDYAEVCRRFHDAGIMINGSFVFGFDCDGPDVFERTVEFTVENKILTASFHVLTPLPGTRAFRAAGGREPACCTATGRSTTRTTRCSGRGA